MTTNCNVRDIKVSRDKKASNRRLIYPQSAILLMYTNIWHVIARAYSLPSSSTMAVGVIIISMVISQ